MFLGVVLFVVLAGAAVPAWRGDRQSAAVLVVVSAFWLYADKWFEGPILIRFGHDHALVLADLVALTALMVAAAGVVRAREPDRTR